MRVLLLILAVLLVAAGCANNRAGNPDIAPSRQASLTGDNSGWSVPPGQKTVTDPDSAAQGVTAPGPKAKEDEASLAEAARNRREEAARQARARLRDGRPEGDKGLAAGSPAASTPAAQPRVQPLVPAFPVRMETDRVLSLRTVQFGFDQFDLTDAARAVLEENARWLKAHPEVTVRIEGHADERGTPEYNLALGERRAKGVREYLIGLGVIADNLSTVSYGEEVPLDPASSEAAWSRNRRAEFTRGEARQLSSLR